jgi:TolB-like protein
MPSLIPGYEYDIFISYRHKDNLGDHWVTEFVSALKTELGSTFKEDISIYFDSNPHDGLLETHNVDKSLEGKLKCLIFIPIISQTYCDTKSFAWQREFCAFNKLAKEDQFGRDIKLNNGNVASRILPIKIHDLDAEDKTLLEIEINGVLRAIEFIFKSAGVNRPLLSQEDHPRDNLNKTFYRDQVNKVANAIKEIITSLKNPVVPAKQATITKTPPTNKLNNKRKTLAIIGISFLLTTAGYFIYSKLEHSTIEIDKSVAVLAFSDMSPGKDQEWFSDGLTAEILNSLTKLNELKVTARTSSFYFKGKDVPLQEIAAKLGVAHIVEGSVKKLDNKLRITAQLIRASDGFHIWSETYDRSAEDLFSVQTDIAEKIAKSLLQELTPEEKEKLHSLKPDNVEAYEYYLRGLNIHLDLYLPKGLQIYFEESEKYLLKAISLEPSYAEAYGALANLYDSRIYKSSDLIKTRYTILRDSVLRIGYDLNPNSADVLLAYFETVFTRNSDSAFYFLKGAYQRAPDRADINHTICKFYNIIGLSELAVKYGKKSVELEPLSPSYLQYLMYSQSNLNQFDDATQTAKRIIELNDKDVESSAYVGLFFASVVQNKHDDARRYIKSIDPIHLNKMRWMQEYLLAVDGIKPEKPTDDLFILSLLKMKAEFLEILDKKTTPNKDGNVYLDPAILSRAYYDFVRNEPEFKVVLARVIKSHEIMIAKYGDMD